MLILLKITNLIVQNHLVKLKYIDLIFKYIN